MKQTFLDVKHIQSTALDVLLVPVLEDAKVLPELPIAITNAFSHAQDVAHDEAFTGKWNTTLLVRSTDDNSSVRRVVFYGIGKKEQWTTERARRMIGSGAQLVQRMKMTRMGVMFDACVSQDVSSVETLSQALAESVILATYQYAQYKTEEDAKKKPLTHIAYVASKKYERTIDKGIRLGSLFAQGTVYARNLINAPANHMTPTVLLKSAQKLTSSSVKVTAYNRAAMKKLGLNTILAVASGSEQEPYLIHLRYTPKGPKSAMKAAMKFALCGKGITFDSGGLQVKPGVHMDGMKYDMAAAGMIIGMFSVLEELQPNIEFHGVIAATENMSSGSAMKPGDVVTSYSGKTIEIGHTDAEGRLVLADALAWAEKNIQPDILVDAATLTGAAIYALGQEYAGIMGSNPELVDAITASATATDENLWPLPLVDDYAVFLESKIADLNNLPPVNWAGTTMGAMFLQKFVEKTPWAHLDIAGPAWVDRVVKSYVPEGASGYGVRTFLHMLLSLSGKRWKK
ncbi:MAG: leucyl aminopeptidase family protein [Candidatus Kerfeldbacteria bacterium]|nr:leucyl aminopeptidase family protein [Candidatus Kerfeldbacteria bacterium]